MAIGIGKDLYKYTTPCKGLVAKAPYHAGLMSFAIRLEAIIIGLIVMEVELEVGLIQVKKTILVLQL
jgi:hypothetical protein